MRILLDHCVPKPLCRAFPSHQIKTAADMGWENLKNGLLLAVAAESFDVVLTVDKGIEHQQNLNTILVAVIVLDSPSNTPEALLPFAPFVEAALPKLRIGQVIEIDSAGQLTEKNQGRS